MDKEHLYEFVKNYLEGAMKVEVDSDFARGYQQGLRSLKNLLGTLEKSHGLIEQLENEDSR